MLPAVEFDLVVIFVASCRVPLGGHFILINVSSFLSFTRDSGAGWRVGLCNGAG